MKTKVVVMRNICITNLVIVGIVLIFSNVKLILDPF